MDFIRLAVRDVRRNGSRTGLAIAATALATAILVLSRIVPEGYMKYQAYAERTFAGGDILIWRAPAHVYSKDTSPLEWRAWTGEEWQSYAEYFLPELPSKGYICPADAPPWGPLDAKYLTPRIFLLEGVAGVSPYLSLPCKVKVGEAYVEAILRGRVFLGPAQPLSMNRQVKIGRPLGSRDEGQLTALIPLESRPKIPYTPYTQMELLLPRQVTGTPGASTTSGVPTQSGTKGSSGPVTLSWDDPVSVSLKPVGAYVVELGLGSTGLPAGATVEPSGYWRRPEIMVSWKTFMDLYARISDEHRAGPVTDAPHVPDTPSQSPAAGLPGASGSGSVAPEPPAYQLLVRVIRHSEIKIVVDRLRETLGPHYAVYSVAELVEQAGGGPRLIVPDMSSLVKWMIFTMAAGIVAASVYVLLALQTRKIGLLRAIGATSKDIIVYALSAVAYTALAGIVIGFVFGKLVALTVLAATDFTFQEWLAMAGYDALLSLSGIVIPLVLGVAVALWASRIPCSEVLRRE